MSPYHEIAMKFLFNEWLEAHTEYEEAEAISGLIERVVEMEMAKLQLVLASDFGLSKNEAESEGR